MQIKKITLTNFKKWQKETKEFEFGLNNFILISGQNASGKTTIIDGIYLAFTKKTSENRDFDTSNYTNTDPIEVTVEFFINNQLHYITRRIDRKNGKNTWTTTIDASVVPDKMVNDKLMSIGIVDIKNFMISTHPLFLIDPSNSTKEGTIQLLFNQLKEVCKDDLDKIANNLANFKNSDGSQLFDSHEIDNIKHDAFKIIEYFNEYSKESKLSNNNYKQAEEHLKSLEKELSKDILDNATIKAMQKTLADIRTNIKNYNDLITSKSILEKQNQDLLNENANIKDSRIPLFNKKIEENNNKIALLNKEDYLKKNEAQQKEIMTQIESANKELKELDNKKYVAKENTNTQSIMEMVSGLFTNLKTLIAKTKLEDATNIYNNDSSKLKAHLDTIFGDTNKRDELAFNRNKEVEKQSIENRIAKLNMSLESLKSMGLSDYEKDKKQYEDNIIQINSSIKSEENRVKTNLVKIQDNENTLKQIDVDTLKSKIAIEENQWNEMNNKLVVANSSKSKLDEAQRQYSEEKAKDLAAQALKRKFLALTDAKNQCLAIMTNYVNERTKFCEITMTEMVNGIETFKFQIKSKNSKTTYYNMNNATKYLVGFELANLFQSLNHVSLPIIFDNVEAIDTQSRKEVVRKFIKDIYNEGRDCQLFFVKVSDEPLQISVNNIDGSTL